MPIALRYGVPVDVFWDMNPKRLEPWQRMFEFQEQARKDDIDYQAWLQGRYVLEAIANNLQGGQSAPYPEEPYMITQRRQEQEDADKQAAENFMAFAMVFNERFRKEHPEEQTKG